MATMSWNAPTSTISIVLTSTEKAHMVWFVRRFGATYVKDKFQRLINTWGAEKSDTNQAQILSLASTDNDVINLLRTKGVDL